MSRVSEKAKPLSLIKKNLMGSFAPRDAYRICIASLYKCKFKDV